MKKQLFALLTISVLSFQFLQAQTEIKMGPVALLFGVGALGIEYGINDEFGIELDAWASGGGGAVYAVGKYYFNPRRGLDRFHMGIFLGGVTELGAGIGFIFGSKVVSRKNIIFDFGLGAGRSFEGGILPYGKLHVGYRFRGKTY